MICDAFGVVAPRAYSRGHDGSAGVVVPVMAAVAANLNDQHANWHSMSRTNTLRNQSLKPWQRRLHIIIYEAETPAGKAFDIALLVCIVLSVAVVMADSVGSIRINYGTPLYALEWVFTILFTIEYILRLLCVGRPLRYATSVFGIIDLLAIVPTYMSLVIPGSHYLVIIRILRVLRIFRVFKLVQCLGEAELLWKAMKASLYKITVFVTTVSTLVVVLGALMYLIEGERNGFSSIPKSVYWAIVTVTTVGYGDISPQTTPGQFLAAIAMIMGYSIIAVPTGLMTVELSHAFRAHASSETCPQCSRDGHDDNADYCKYCGAKL